MSAMSPPALTARVQHTWQGEALLVFTRNAALLASTMPPEAVKKLIVPLLVRSADQGAPALASVQGPNHSQLNDAAQTSAGM